MSLKPETLAVLRLLADTPTACNWSHDEREDILDALPALIAAAERETSKDAQIARLRDALSGLVIPLITVFPALSCSDRMAPALAALESTDAPKGGDA